MADNCLSVLHDHYKDTCTVAREHKVERDRRLIWLALGIGAIFVDVVAPGACEAIVQALITKNTGATVKLGNPVVGVVVRAVVTWVTLRYFQAVITVERSYPTIHAIEEDLNKECEQVIFRREKDGYLDRYPKLLDFAHGFYNVVLPVLIIAAGLYRHYHDCLHVSTEGWGWLLTKSFLSVVFITIPVLFIYDRYTCLCQRKVVERAEQLPRNGTRDAPEKATAKRSKSR